MKRLPLLILAALTGCATGGYHRIETFPDGRVVETRFEYGRCLLIEHVQRAQIPTQDGMVVIDGLDSSVDPQATAIVQGLAQVALQAVAASMCVVLPLPAPVAPVGNQSVMQLPNGLKIQLAMPTAPTTQPAKVPAALPAKP